MAAMMMKGSIMKKGRPCFQRKTVTNVIVPQQRWSAAIVSKIALVPITVAYTSMEK